MIFKGILPRNISDNATLNLQGRLGYDAMNIYVRRPQKIECEQTRGIKKDCSRTTKEWDSDKEDQVRKGKELKNNVTTRISIFRPIVVALNYFVAFTDIRNQWGSFFTEQRTLLSP